MRAYSLFSKALKPEISNNFLMMERDKYPDLVLFGRARSLSLASNSRIIAALFLFNSCCFFSSCHEVVYVILQVQEWLLILV